MAYGKRFWVYPVAAVLIAVIIIAGTAVYMGVHPKSAQTSYSVLVVKLTDPPQVPQGTVWLNMTFTQVSLLVGEPTGTSGQFAVKSITFTPPGGASTLDLLGLQNYTVTVAQANLTPGSVLYSITFTVQSVEIDVNGTQSQVTLAGSANTLQAVIANPHSLSGDNEALIELNPLVVNTPSGYQLVASAVAVVGPTKEIGHVGGESTISQEEQKQLQEARGNLSVKVVSLTTSGENTTFTLLVNNTGSIPVQLVGVAIHGDFNVTGSACRASGAGGHNEGGDHGNNGVGEGDNNNSTGNTKDTASNKVVFGPDDHTQCEHPDEVLFVPVNNSTPQGTTTTTITTTSTTTSNTCQVFNMRVVGSDNGNDNSQGDENQPTGIVIQPHECVQLTFKGAISFGSSNLTLIPTLATGSTYTIHIIASNSAEQKLACTAPISPASCAQVQEDNESD
ncbi:MAG: hypothetical protein QXP58_07160 [Thermoprotei archaeon]